MKSADDDVDYDPFGTAAKLNASLHACYRNHVNKYPNKTENQDVGSSEPREAVCTQEVT